MTLIIGKNESRKRKEQNSAYLGISRRLFGEDNPREKKGESSSLMCGTKGTRAIHMF